ncbi:MAG TPA: UDP-N-acetylmuramoyl-tripeptide--D-alanyl-D-alanine ligase [Anaerolineae bacterium]|nr:UDP-N-acetylmuramoyl-tripeptide--D-alanyl-D-alanine ligase [Anaerolineae bacterium]
MQTVASLIVGIRAGQPAMEVPGGAEAIAIRGFAIDSREVKPGNAFVALPGEHLDGHDFALAAVAAGAVAVLAERAPDGFPGSVIDLRTPEAGPSEVTAPVCLVVQSSLAALQRAAGEWRNRSSVRVVAITGSVGKTTCKELTAAILGRSYRTLHSKGNYNNEIGLPLTLLQLEATHERLVLEMGMYALGEIRQLAAIARPHIGVVTNVGHSHLERLVTVERIAQAKSELPDSLPPAEEGGVAILNVDDDRVLAMQGSTRARVFGYGLRPQADLWADEIESQGLEGVRFRFRFGRRSVPAHLPMLGRHSVHSALAAASVALVEGQGWPDIIAGLSEQSAQLRIVVVQGPAGSTIIEDTYNSSPASALAALNLLSELAGRRVAVLGGMLELGSFTHEGHKLVGRRAREVADQLVTVGVLGRLIGEEALLASMPSDTVHMAADNAEAAALLQRIVQRGDTVLIKGSRAMHMEEIVAAITSSYNGSSVSGAKER